MVVIGWRCWDGGDGMVVMAMVIVMAMDGPGKG